MTVDIPAAALRPAMKMTMIAADVAARRPGMMKTMTAVAAVAAVGSGIRKGIQKLPGAGAALPVTKITMTIAAAVAGGVMVVVAGSETPKVMPKRHASAGKTTIAAAGARALARAAGMRTMTTAEVAGGVADVAAGSEIRKDIPKPRANAGKTMTTVAAGAARAHVPAVGTKTTMIGVTVAAAGSAIPKATPVPPVEAGGTATRYWLLI
jgi:hypothetical protein